MRLTRVRFTVLGMMIAVGAACVGMRAVDRCGQLDRAARSRYAASLALYQEIERLFQGGEVHVREVYDQARRVLEAQREMGDSAWPADHLKRMRAVQKFVAGLPGNVCLDKQSREFVDYMVKEAEFWALRETW